MDDGSLVQIVCSGVRKGDCGINAINFNINKSIQAVSGYLVHRMSRKQQCSEEDAREELFQSEREVL